VAVVVLFVADDVVSGRVVEDGSFVVAALLVVWDLDVVVAPSVVVVVVYVVVAATVASVVVGSVSSGSFDIPPLFVQ